jgi:hypothetical protein
MTNIFILCHVLLCILDNLLFMLNDSLFKMFVSWFILHVALIYIAFYDAYYLIYYARRCVKQIWVCETDGSWSALVYRYLSSHYRENDVCWSLEMSSFFCSQWVREENHASKFQVPTWSPPDLTLLINFIPCRDGEWQSVEWPPPFSGHCCMTWNYSTFLQGEFKIRPKTKIQLHRFF